MQGKSNYIKNGIIAGALSLPLLFGGCYKVIHPVEGQKETTIASIVKEIHPKSLESIIKKESKKFHEELTDEEFDLLYEQYGSNIEGILRNKNFAIYYEKDGHDVYYDIYAKNEQFKYLNKYVKMSVNNKDVLVKVEEGTIGRVISMKSVFETPEKRIAYQSIDLKEGNQFSDTIYIDIWESGRVSMSRLFRDNYSYRALSENASIGRINFDEQKIYDIDKDKESGDSRIIDKKELRILDKLDELKLEELKAL